MKNFETLVNALSKSNIPCKVKKFKDKEELSVECGWNYPDKLFLKIDNIASKLDIKVSVSAEVSGGTVEASKTISGGPKRY
jgi:hypothetical protein